MRTPENHILHAMLSCIHLHNHRCVLQVAYTVPRVGSLRGAFCDLCGTGMESAIGPSLACDTMALGSCEITCVHVCICVTLRVRVSVCFMRMYSVGTIASSRM